MNCKTQTKYIKLKVIHAFFFFSFFYKQLSFRRFHGLGFTCYLLCYIHSLSHTLVQYDITVEFNTLLFVEMYY